MPARALALVLAVASTVPAASRKERVDLETGVKKGTIPLAGGTSTTTRMRFPFRGPDALLRKAPNDVEKMQTSQQLNTAICLSFVVLSWFLVGLGTWHQVAKHHALMKNTAMEDMLMGAGFSGFLQRESASVIFVFAVLVFISWLVTTYSAVDPSEQWSLLCVAIVGDWAAVSLVS